MVLGQVSWYRKDDYQILTTGLFSFTTDERFVVIHAGGSDLWQLKISNTRTSDQGLYQCQRHDDDDHVPAKTKPGFLAALICTCSEFPKAGERQADNLKEPAKP
ncbi:unnamed protein product [Cyprideis torosa]|uniref:Uncharacterized protein n=1 Tax=Cyprideis torosa TaxID=163714 RepID=A0A7R8W8Y5_9CRUS|nr:unnamed protein product [Cyprideis torosa]CAG0889114.1 unnamed protein product [Cyprideis torosa]